MTPRPWLALQVTLAAQMLATFVISIAPVLAPAVAPKLGVAAQQVGMFTGTAYLFAMISGLALGPWINRVGPVRATQLVLATAALGALLTTQGGGASLLVAAALIGIGYGGANPSAAAILGRHVPAHAAGLFFALKQAGVPAGVALAGLLLPIGLVWPGWRETVWLLAGVCLLLAGLFAPTARLLEPAERGAAPRGLAFAGSLLQVMRHPALRRLSLMSTAYAMTQLGFLTFSVSLLVHLGVPLALAAGLLAASQVAAVATRIGMGHVADRWIAPRLLLGLLGLAMALASLTLALLPAAPPVPVAALVRVLTGATTMGWNGVFFAQLVRVVPREELAQSSGGTQFFTFAGSMLGPYLFSQLLGLGGSYALGYCLLAALAALASLAMLLGREG